MLVIVMNLPLNPWADEKNLDWSKLEAFAE